ncbi:L-seryl-tRNA(Sec) selenium transferase [compost metagenome]
MPGAELPSFAVTLAPERMSAHALAACLRQGEPEVVGRLEADRIWLDVRTLLDGDEDGLVLALESALA